MKNKSGNDLFEGEVSYEIAKRLSKAIRNVEFNFEDEFEAITEDIYEMVNEEGEEVVENEIREVLEEHQSKLAGPLPERKHLSGFVNPYL